MKHTKSGSIALLLALILASSVLYAAPAESQGDSGYKIGVVNVKQVFDSYDRQKKEYEKLQAERDKKQTEIDKLSDKISAEKDRYDKESSTMSESDRDKLEEQIQSDYSQYKADFKRLQEDIDRQEKRLLQDVFDDIHLAIQEIGAREDYHLILEAGQPGRTTVLYSSTTLDLTQQVTDQLNQKFAGGN